MEQHDVPYQRQIFVCTNDNHGEKPSCCDHASKEIFAKLRAIAKERGLHPKVRVAQATCLGQCAHGVTVMVYPENVWHKKVRMEDVNILAEMYIKE